MFKHLVNEAGFIDLIKLSVWAEGRPVLDQLLESRNTGILSSKSSKYARCLWGKTPLTGNPVRMLYGKVSRFERVPPVSISMRSENLPLTGAQVNETVRLLCPAATRVQPTVAELTFDLTGVSVSRLHTNAIYRARKYKKKNDPVGNKTVYVGSPRSPWQLRIYDKVPGVVVRVEVILRRGFLSKLGIGQPDGILKLRLLDMERMFSIRSFSKSSVAAATEDWDDSYWRQMVLDWEDDGRELQLLRRMLAARLNNSELVFPRSPVQDGLEKMQRNLIW